MSDILDNLKFIFKTMKGHIFLIIWAVLMFPMTIVAINLCAKYITIDFLKTWIFPCCVYPLFHMLIGYLIVLFTVKEKKETIDAFRKLCKLSLYVGWFFTWFLLGHEGIISSLLISLFMTNILYVVISILVGVICVIIGKIFNVAGISFSDYIMFDWLLGSK